MVNFLPAKGKKKRKKGKNLYIGRLDCAVRDIEIDGTPIYYLSG